MKCRKTIAVKAVLDKANELLARTPSTRLTPEFRAGVSALLESVLFETNTYAGFNYLDWCNGGHDAWRAELATGNPSDPAPSTEAYLGDQSRRVYYTSPRLGGPIRDYNRPPETYPQSLERLTRQPLPKEAS